MPQRFERMAAKARRDPNVAIETAPRILARVRAELPVLTLVLLAVLAYVNTVHHPFLYDDVALVLQNPDIRSLSNLPALVGFEDGAFRLVPRWTRDVTYALEYAAVGAWPPLFHLTNIVLHVVAGLLVYKLVSRLTEDKGLGFWTAALFVLHPVGTDVVAQISGRRELLATLFCLGSLLLLQRFTSTGGVFRAGAALVCLYLGVFSKEMAVMAPAVFLLLDLYERARAAGHGPLRESRRPGGLLRGTLEVLLDRKVLYSCLFLAMACLTAGRLFGIGGEGLGGSPGFYETAGSGLSFLDRARLMGMGIRLLVFPVGQSVDYSYDALGMTAGGVTTLGILDLLVLLAAVGATIAGLRARAYVGVGGMWFLLFYLPTSGLLIPWHEIFAERFLYLPSIGFCLAAGSGIVWLQKNPRSGRVATATGFAVLSLLMVGTILRNEVWRSGEKLWSAAIARFPNCARAHKALADQYLASGRPDLALPHYRDAARILPPYRDAHIGIGAALVAMKRRDDALAAFEEVLHRWPEEPKTLNNIGMIYRDLRRADRALDAFERATRSNPRLAEPYNNMGGIYTERGDLTTAVRMYEKALERDPSLVPALRNLAMIYRYGFHDEERARRFDRQAEDLLAAR